MTPSTTHLFGSGPCTEPTLLDGYQLLTVPDVLTEAQCARLREWAEPQPWEHEAPINGPGGFVTATDVRNNDRLIVDDESWASALWNRVRLVFPHVNGCAPVGINERFRFYRYQPGQYFRAHQDGYYQRPGTRVRSVFTVMLYLSSVEQGGATRFYDADHTVTPRAGMVCAFVHRQLHAGEEVVRGEKWVLRTDVMYDLDRQV